MRKIGVAGATGFIGARVVRALTEAGHDVVAIGRGEISDCDTIVWAAGKREATLEDNLAVHRDAAVAQRAKHIVYLSSGEVYGDAPIPYREDGPTRSTSPYALAKLAGEQALIDRAVVLRLGLVYGPGQRPQMLIPSLVRALRNGERFPLTTGEQTRDLVHMDDVARAVIAAIDARPAIYNIASGVETRIKDVCLEIARAVGASRDLLGFGEKELRPDEATRYVLDVQRARVGLGWRTSINLARGVATL